MIHVHFDASRIRQQFAAIPEAVDKTIRATMKNVLVGFRGPTELQVSVEKLMVPNIDRPTPFTANGRGVAFYGAVSDSGPVVGRFGIKRLQAPYLQAILKGIPRDQKVIERRTPDGRLLVPARSVQLDRYGNVPRRLYEQIFRQAFSGSAGSQYYWQPQRKGKTPAGIYMRKNENGQRAKTQLQFLAVQSAEYKKQWDFYASARTEILRLLPQAMDEAIAVRLRKLQVQS